MPPSSAQSSPRKRRRRGSDAGQPSEDILKEVHRLPADDELRKAFETQIDVTDQRFVNETLQQMTEHVKRTPANERQNVLVKYCLQMYALGELAKVDLRGMLAAIDQSQAEMEGEEVGQDDFVEHDGPRRRDHPEERQSEPEPEEQLELKKPKIGLDGHLDKETLITEMVAFRDGLMGEKIRYRDSGTWKEVQFNEKRATELTNFFFHEFVGINAIRRLKSLIAAYTNPERGLAYHIGIKAKAAAKAPGCPPVEKDLFNALSNFVADSRKDDEFKRFSRRRHAHDLSEAYHRYYAQVHQSAENSPLIRRMNTCPSAQPAVGRGWSTRVLNYLGHVCDAKPADIRLAIRNVSLIGTLVDSFGVGVLLVLPGEIDRNIIDCGTQVVRTITNRFTEAVPSARKYFKLLELTVYRPIVNGRPDLLPDSRNLDLAAKDHFYGKILRACPPTADMEEELANMNLDSDEEESSEESES